MRVSNGPSGKQGTPKREQFERLRLADQRTIPRMCDHIDSPVNAFLKSALYSSIHTITGTNYYLVSQASVMPDAR